MRSEHKTTADEWDACTGWRRLLIWRPGERKAIKQRLHRVDRRAEPRRLRDEEEQ